MDHKEKYIEIPFGAKDSELVEATYFIPEGMEAVIEGDKVIIRRKESEDERIRGAIIDHLKDNNLTEWAAWLEKQDEPIDKIVKRAMNEKQRVLLTETNGDANIDWDTRSLQDVKLLLEYGLDYIKKLEKQGEQKPLVIPKFRKGDLIRYKTNPDDVKRVDSVMDDHYILDIKGECTHVLFSCQDLWELVERKPAEWHREDEQNLNACLGFIPDEFLRRWLKDVVHTKYDKPVWSEEDEKFFKTALWHISYSISNGKSTDIHCDTTEWLKSLRPQNHWKPSEEQLNVLHDVAIYIDHTMFPCKKGFLMKLYKQLKKLKEG